MSTSSKSDSENFTFDIEELLHVGARCTELGKETDSLRESQSQSFELIKRLESHVQSLTDARAEDKKRIQGLERDLVDCYGEIGSLQDMLNARNASFQCLGEHISSLEMKLDHKESLHKEIISLRQELRRSNSECLFLKRQLDSTESELQKSTQYLEKLEESISFAALESECDVESMRLEMMTLEQYWFEAKKCEEETIQENTRIKELIHELKAQVDEARGITDTLEKENKELKGMLDLSNEHARLFCARVEEHFRPWLESSVEPVNALSESSRYQTRQIDFEERSACGEFLGPLLSKLLMLKMLDLDLRENSSSTSQKFLEYEKLVKQLKDALREEKFKAKEEAEDLTQEMAELRYQMTELLEEERKRHAYVEQASLKRIAQLEAEIQRERHQSSVPNGRVAES